jgi:hypothetical protein
VWERSGNCSEYIAFKIHNNSDFNHEDEWCCFVLITLVYISYISIKKFKDTQKAKEAFDNLCKTFKEILIEELQN